MSVAIAALVLTCGPQLDGARLQVETLDGDIVRVSRTDIGSGWWVAAAAADVDNDGDDELIVGGQSVAAMQPDGKTTTLLEVDADRALWSSRADGITADLLVWSAYGSTITTLPATSVPRLRVRSRAP